MDIIVSVAAKISEYIVAPIVRPVGYLFSYKANFKKLEDQVKKLQSAKDSINLSIEAERRNGKEILPDVLSWLDEVEEISIGANQLCKDPRRARSCPNLWWRFHLSKEAKSVAERVAEVQNQKRVFRKIGYRRTPSGVGSISSTRHFVPFESSMSIMKEIMRALADHSVSRVGVYGLGGVGKSTLVQQVAGKVKDEKLFDTVVMATVSKNPDIKKIQGEIADQLGLRFPDETVLGRSYRLRDSIKNKKSILIILDDIWETIELEEVGIPIPETINLGGEENLPRKDHMGSKALLPSRNQDVLLPVRTLTPPEKIKSGKEEIHVGCKLLLTSRSQSVLRQMRTQRDFRAEVLSEEETWRLFVVMVGDEVRSPSLQQTATQVIRKCARMPVLVVAALATGLINKDVHAWKEALNKLQRVGDRDQFQDIADSALKLCYKYLENDEVKALFLLCGALGPHINREYLLKCVMGLGIFRGIRTVEDARNRLHEIIDSLKASCLLHEGDTGTVVKMHENVCDVAVSIAYRDEHIFINKRDIELNQWPTEDFLKRCSQIILDRCHIHKLPETLHCPELKLFFLSSANSTLGIPDSFFEGMKNLHMLDLTCMNLTSLPTSFRSLINLKTLCLDQCTLGDIAAIGDLKSLEILSFYQSLMTKLPSEIRQLTNLRMLDLSYSEIKVIPPNIISSLSKLEELYVGNTFVDWEVEHLTRQNENASLAELRQLPNLTALDLRIQESGMLPRDLMFDKLERFKIFIGDAWNWVGSYETSKILKLKLRTRIHSEPVIKALIERVEELYLDEIYGISNVLYQLNSEGFPLLKHLHVQNNSNVHYIVNSLEWNQARDSFPNLETLVLRNLHNLEMICFGSLAVNSFNKLSVIKVESCHQLAYLLSYAMIKGFSQLLEIDVSNCNSMKKIVLVESGTVIGNGMTTDKIEFDRLRYLTLHNLPALDNFYSDNLTTSSLFFGTKVTFPILETLKLSSINLNKNWGDDEILVAYSMWKSLTNLIIEDCGDLKFLFSSSMVGSLLNLKRVEISKCQMMEEIIDTKKVRNNGVPLGEILFPKLETIIINNMKNLKTIWHYQFERLRTMEVNDCEKLVIVFPAYMQRNFHKLETLMITDCGSVEEIFEWNDNELCSAEEIMLQLKRLTLHQLPKLKRIWSRDSQGILSYRNLQVLHVEDCRNLEYLFPFSIATSLWKLEEINIKQVYGMKEIVANRGHMDGMPTFVFNRLTSMVLWNLFNLERFYAGNHTVACPSLKALSVFKCTKLSLFKTQSIDNQGPTPADIIHVSMQQSLFGTVEELIQKLEQLTLSSKDASVLLQGQFSWELFSKLKLLHLYDVEEEETIFPDQFLKSLPRLECLVIADCSFKEIFRDGIFPAEEGHVKTSNQLKLLKLLGLDGLQHICKEGSKIDPILDVLEFMIVKQCPNLINLVPSFDSFSCLTYLEVEKCERMRYLITSPTARSLVKLRVMKIKDCNLLEEIVTEKGDETKDNISFDCLKTLELICLPRLTRFCSSKCYLKYRMLDEVVVRQCPRMKVFSEGDTSTPSLHQVQIEDYPEWRWEGSLNGTIKQLFVDKVAFHALEYLRLSEYPELKDLWRCKLQPKMFNNLKYLVVQECNFLSGVLFESNLLEVLHRLEELEVKDCDSLEAVFDMKSVNDNGIHVKEITQLKNLVLSNLPRLKYIWKNASHEILSFENLCSVNVVECRSLRNLFSVSICQDLRQLEELSIESCGVEEIVAMDEGSEEHCFDFPQLTIMKLWSLTKLKSFYPGGYVLNCPSLKKLSVYHCEELCIFDFDHSNFQQLHQLGGVDIPIRQALFSVEKVCPNLEILTLNERDAMTIWNGHYPASLFGKVDLLSLQCFHQAPTTFPNDFIRTFVNLVTLQVRCSSFKVLFPGEEIGHNSTANSMQIRKLRLYNLDQLKYIWHEDSQWDALDLKLEKLTIAGCSSLENLVPSSMSFKNLTKLFVCDCKGLIYLISFSTAKTLLQLTVLTIENCEMIEDVIHTDEEAEGEIIFENLEYLQLTSLSRLKSFSCGKLAFKFPSLVRLIVEGCPNMKIFSQGIIEAPMIRAVEVEDGKKHWKGDLNATIKLCL